MLCSVHVAFFDLHIVDLKGSLFIGPVTVDTKRISTTQTCRDRILEIHGLNLSWEPAGDLTSFP
jgi:hypothetical protein